MVNKSAVLLLSVVFLLTGCSGKLDFAKLKGSYSGTFSYFHSEDSKAVKNAPVAVNFTQNAYESSSGINYFPAGGTGVFAVLDGQKIKFEDQKIWRTTNFDWELVLNGEYRYDRKGDSLILTKGSSTTNLYQYRLKRVN